MARTQYLSYSLLSKTWFSPVERSLLQVIAIRPDYCLENLSELGLQINRSARTVQRAIQSLVQKGVLIKKYTYFKRIILKLVPMEEQNKIAKNGPISQILKFCKFAKRLKKGYDTTKVSGVDTTSVSHSIKISTKENSIPKTSLKNFDFKPKNLEFEKQRQINAMKLMFPNMNL